MTNFSVRTHVVRMLFAPVLLTVPTLVTIRRVILELLPMIRYPSLALAVGFAADNLFRVIAGGGERFVTVRARGEAHSHTLHHSVTRVTSLKPIPSCFLIYHCVNLIR